MRRYSYFQKVSAALTDLLVVSKIMFSANLLDVIESKGPVLSYDSPPSTVIFVRFDYGKGIGYILLCCKDMLIAAATREGNKKVFGNDALKMIRNKKGTSYVYSILLENLPNALKSDVEKAVGECRELRYPDSLLGTQLYGLKISDNVLIDTEFMKVLLAESDNQKQVLILPSDALVVSMNERIILSSLALDFCVALANNIEVSGLFIPRTKYGSVNEIITAPPSIIIPWVSAILLDNYLKSKERSSARTILAEVIQYVIRAHELGIVHLWLDPRKILVGLSPDGNPKQIFIAGFLGKFPKELIRFINPSYCDPYLLLGAEGVVADVYSLGMIILESLTGSTLESRREITAVLRDALIGAHPEDIKGKSELYSILFSIARKNPSKLRNALSKVVNNDIIKRQDRAILTKVKDRELREVLMRCVSLNIDERPKTAKELLEVLR